MIHMRWRELEPENALVKDHRGLSFPMRECGLKLGMPVAVAVGIGVAPHVGRGLTF